MVPAAVHAHRRLRIANEAKAWEMTAKDIAIYDAAFAKMDKNKDGFVFPAGESTILETCGMQNTPGE